LLIGQWGGYDLTVDPYTKATAGTVRLVVNCYFDAAAARSTSFSVINISV
jgi:protein subunit release factor B